MKQAKAVIILFICIAGAVSSVFEGVLFLSETILNPYLLIKREKNDSNKGIVNGTEHIGKLSQYKSAMLNTGFEFFRIPFYTDCSRGLFIAYPFIAELEEFDTADGETQKEFNQEKNYNYIIRGFNLSGNRGEHLQELGFLDIYNYEFKGASLESLKTKAYTFKLSMVNSIVIRQRNDTCLVIFDVVDDVLRRLDKNTTILTNFKIEQKDIKQEIFDNENSTSVFNSHIEQAKQHNNLLEIAKFKRLVVKNKLSTKLLERRLRRLKKLIKMIGKLITKDEVIFDKKHDGILTKIESFASSNKLVV